MWSSTWNTSPIATSAMTTPDAIRSWSACERIRAAASRPPRAITSIGIAAPIAYARGAADRPSAEVRGRRRGGDARGERRGAGKEHDPGREAEKEPAPCFRGPQPREDRGVALE